MRTSAFLNDSDLSDTTMAKVGTLHAIASRRGQSLAQLALTWALRDPRMTSLIIGASSVEQLEDNIAALNAPPFSREELDEIDGTVLDL